MAADEAKPTVPSGTVPEGDDLQITLPDDWEQWQNRNALAPTITLRPKNNDAELKITFIADTKDAFAKKEQLEKAVRTSCQQYVDHSVEKEIKLKTLESKNGTCVYAEFTDAALVGKTPQPGEFKAIASGVMLVGKSVAIFTLVGNLFEDKSYIASKDILKSGITLKK
jgi:hypothetical protein